MVRVGRSRVWIRDAGWWLLAVEFQPSSWRAGQAYLNVGEQHLWVERDHIVFEEPDRPLGAAHTADLASDDSVLVVLMDTAAEAVTRRIAEHEEGDAALRRLVRLDDDLNAGIAAALLGDVPTATQRLSGAVHPAYTAQA